MSGKTLKIAGRRDGKKRIFLAGIILKMDCFFDGWNKVVRTLSDGTTDTDWCYCVNGRMHYDCWYQTGTNEYLPFDENSVWME